MIALLSGGGSPDRTSAPTAATSAVSAVEQGFGDVDGGGVVEPPPLLALPLLPLLLPLLLLPPHAAIAIDPNTASRVA